MFRFAALIAAALAALLSAQQSALAQATPRNFENLDRIDSLVAMTVGANMGQPGGPANPVDRRLRLAACPSTPTVDGPLFGAAIVKCDALGWRIRVPLVPGGAFGAAPGAGQPFSAGAGQPAPRAAPAAPRTILIKRGDPVQLIAGGSAFTVYRQMVADQDGALGDLIRVKGEDRNAAPVFARVEEMGKVRVPGFNND